jgi:hypothetical protein
MNSTPTESSTIDTSALIICSTGRTAQEAMRS